MRLFFVLLLTLVGCNPLSSFPPPVQTALSPTISTATVTLTASATTTQTPASTAEAVRQDLLGRINTLRAANSLPPYRLNPMLVASAQNQAEWMVKTGEVVHIHDDGSRPSTRAEAAGYPNPASVSENIYMGQIATPDYAWDFWIHSEIHYKGLVSPWHDEIGIGTAHSDEQGQSFVLVFGASGKPWPTQPSITPTTMLASSGTITIGSPVPTAILTVTPTVALTVPGGPKVYIVQPGDTLFKIATRNGKTVSELAAANGITNPDVLEVGQMIVIP